MKKYFLILVTVACSYGTFSQYDLNQMILNGMMHYEGEIDLFPTESTYKLITDCATKNGQGKIHFKNDTCDWGSLNNIYSYTLLPTAKNIELIFKEAKSIVDFYKFKPYGDCDFFQPAMQYYNNEEVGRILDGGTAMAYLSLGKTINYTRLAELGKDKSIYFTIEWVLVPNRLTLRVFMNDQGFAGLALFDANGFKAY